MIIKEADDKKSQIAALAMLESRSDCPPDTRKRINQEIRNIRAGIKGENEAAYELMVHWGESRNWMIIHDLRIEYGDLVAQIDHLIINRWLEMWVCESKHFSEGVSINEHGEFTAFFGGKPYGVPSPIEQNNKHLVILRRLFESGAVKLPTRLGFTIKPDLKSLVVVSKGARIGRPKNKIDGLEFIIKNDQVFKTIDKSVEDNNLLMLAKVVGQDTLEQVARDIASLHCPIQFNWAAKFGLPAVAPISTPILQAQPKPVESTFVPVVEPMPATIQDTVVAKPEMQHEGTSQKPRQKLICHSCSSPVTFAVAKYCWGNKPKFGGNIFCFDCQKTIKAA